MAGEICGDKVPPAFCYSDQAMNQIHHHHGFESNPSEIMGFPTGMEMIGFPKNHHMFGKSGNSSLAAGGVPSSSKVTTINEPDFYQGMSESGGGGDKFMIMGGSCNDPSGSNSWHDQNHRMLLDDSSIRCVFPCEGNERPSQGLSLSLSSNHPSSIGLQSFELRQTNQSHMIGNGNQIPFQMRNSKFLAPAQEILNEFCSLGVKQMDSAQQKLKSSSKNKQFEFDDEDGIGSSSRKQQQSLYSLDFMELQKRKTKLISMLEEVDRRYKHYCDQMKAVVSSFEAVAGSGAASVYSALASKAMSRHFRCLRDGIVTQIQATRKAMGEKDPTAPGTTRGETPRLRILDQTLRQQRAFQQMTMMESHPWRPQRGLPERSVSVLRAWLFEHFLHPYPSDVDKHILARQTGLSRSQVSNWFINARVRLWKPMVEEMYLEELKEQENNMASSSDGIPGGNDSQIPFPDQKPTADQLVRVDSECLSSIISTSDRMDPKSASKAVHHQNQYSQHGFGSYGGTAGAIDLDFSTYNHHHAAAGGVGGGVGVAFSGDQTQNFNAGDVSLTLGLQQHGGSGTHMGFPSAGQSSFLYSRDHMEDCQQVQYSMLDGDHQGQHLPYRNLMGAQLLHDLAG